MPNFATDADIRRLKARGERPELISLSRRDEVPHGGATLCVRVYPTGEKSWVARFRRKSLPSLLAFGRFCQGEPDHMPLALARQIHTAFNQAVSAGAPTREELLRIVQDFRGSHGRVQSLVIAAESAVAAASQGAVALRQSAAEKDATALLQRVRYGHAEPVQRLQGDVGAPVAATSDPSKDPVAVGSGGPVGHNQEPSSVATPSPAATTLHLVPTRGSGATTVWAPTLKELFDQYLDALETRGSKTTVRDYKSAFKRHIEVPRPALAAKLAHEVTPEELADLIHEVFVRPSRQRGIEQVLAIEKADASQYDGRLENLGHDGVSKAKNQKREAERLRSMLSTAYNHHIQCKSDPTVKAEYRRPSAVKFNPLQHIKAIEGAIQARRRKLSALELGFLMLCLERVSTPAARAIQLLVWLGGQRLEQVLRAKREDVVDGCTALTLLDPKGNRPQAREHLLPLEGPARELIQAAVDHADSRKTLHLFTTSGRKVLSSDTVSELLLSIKLEMLTRGVITTDFDVRDIRRTFETFLASKKVDDKVRAHLFSHGIGGVQDEHYNLYEYFAEKQEALHTLHAYVHEAIDKARREMGHRLPQTIALKVNGTCKGLVGLGAED